MELGTLYYRNKDGEMVPLQGITEAKFEDCSGYSEWADEKVIDSISAGQEFSFELKPDDMIAHWWMMYKLGILDYYNRSPVWKDDWLWNHVSVLQVGFARRLYGIFGIRALRLYTACDPLLSIYAKARFTKGGMYQEWLTKRHGREHVNLSMARIMTEAFEAATQYAVYKKRGIKGYLKKRDKVKKLRRNMK